MILAALVDSREVTGVNVWLKPIKYAASAALYLWTVALLLRHAHAPAWALRTTGRGIAVSMALMVACVALQAARGTTSHYNVGSLFDFVIFQIIGVLILLNTLFTLLLLSLFLFLDSDLPPAYLWGVRFGLIFVLAGGLEGMLMILNQAHTIGAPDGGPGLPLLNWSTRAGDLRPAHLLGVHAIQLLPLAGHWLSRRGMGAIAMCGVALAYAALMALLIWQAELGRPLIRL